MSQDIRNYIDIISESSQSSLGWSSEDDMSDQEMMSLISTAQDPHHDPETATYYKEVKAAFDNAIAQLSPQRRRALELYIENPSANKTQMAQELGMNPTAFFKNVVIGLGKIRRNSQWRRAMGLDPDWQSDSKFSARGP